MPGRFAAKRLATVEVKATRSNQHEFNAGLLRRALGIDANRVTGPFTLLFFTGDDKGAVIDESEFTLYDSREKKQALRSAEYRLYYKSVVLERHARPGDLFVAYRPARGNRLFGVVARSGTRAERELVDALQLGDEKALKRFVEASAAPTTAGTAAALGVAPPDGRPPTDVEAHSIVREAGRLGKAPPSEVIAEAGRALSEERHGAHLNPDDFLHFAEKAETDLYFAIEEAVHGDPLRQLFATGRPSVGQMLAAVGRVSQARKSRRGQSLQHHFAALLDREDVPFTSQCVTERKEKPDFVIPGKDAYDLAAFPAAHLRMVACKSRIRERWPQVLKEAERIEEKYILTLDEELTEDSLDNMRHHRLAVFMPRRVLEDAYTVAHQNVADVSDLIARLQEAVRAGAPFAP
jgi:hypothetical protein